MFSREVIKKEPQALTVKQIKQLQRAFLHSGVYPVMLAPSWPFSLLGAMGLQQASYP